MHQKSSRNTLMIVFIGLGVIACNIPVMNNVSLSIGLATHTPESDSWTATPTATGTETASATPTLTQTATATETPTQTASVTETPDTPECNRAEFVWDVNYPDGSYIHINKAFDKTWRLRNVGTCTWTPSYAVVFTSGYRMGAPYSSSISNVNVPPGSTVDITLPFTAPATPGTYSGSFYLRSKSGEVFGVGADGTTPFWVRINAVSFYYTNTPTKTATPRHHHPHWPPPPTKTTAPTTVPTVVPTTVPTAAPTAAPTVAPTDVPTAIPPTSVPSTAIPSTETPVPTVIPT